MMNLKGFVPTILNFAKNIVTKRQLRGIELILNPCCPPVISSIDFTCGGGNTDLVITLAKPISLLGLGTASVVSSVDGTLRGTAVVTDANTITITSSATTAGSATYILTLFLPTNQANSQVGVFLKSAAFTATSC
jgi:uncharacterized membrane-anchored protein